MRVACSLTLVLSLTLGMLLSAEAVEPLPPTTAAAPAAPAAATPQEAAFAANLAKWKPLVTEIGKLQFEYQRTNPMDKAALEAVVKKFEPLQKQAAELAPLLRKSAEDAYVVNPANKEVADLVFEFFLSDISDQNIKEATRMADMLRPQMLNNPDEKVKAAFFLELAMMAWHMNDYSAASAILQDEKLISKNVKNPQITKLATEATLRAAEAKADDLPRVKISTTKGDIVVELFENEAPNTVANFISLVEKKFYDGIAFHRVLDGFMAQVGDPLTKDNDPRNDGTGGPGYTIKCECTSPKARMHYRGSLSMAHAGPDTGGSQFFLTFSPTQQLDGKHTVFGRVIEGQDILDKIQRIDPEQPNPNIKPDVITSATVVRKRNHDYVPVTGPNK